MVADDRWSRERHERLRQRRVECQARWTSDSADIVVQTPCIRGMEDIDNGEINSILLRQTAVDTEVYYRVLN